MPIVNPIAPDVGSLADPWLSVGTHPAPTHPVPDQGDWQWCMMEAAAWMADEAWSSDPANVSPVIAAACNAFNDLLADNARQDLKAFLDVAPAGVIDTVDAGKETDREWMCVDWLVRTLLPMWLDYIDDADVSAASADIGALPALAAGTFDEAATLAALEVAGRAVWAFQATQEHDAFDSYGGGSATFASASLAALYDALGGDYIDHGLGLARGADGFTSIGTDNGAEAAATAVRAANQAVWDVMLVWVPVALFTGRAADLVYRRGGNYVPGSAFLMLRDVVWALTTKWAQTAALSAVTIDGITGFADLYSAAFDAAQDTLTGAGGDTDSLASISTLLAALCAY